MASLRVNVTKPIELVKINCSTNIEKDKIAHLFF